MILLLLRTGKKSKLACAPKQGGYQPPLTPALGCEQFLIAPARATAMAGLTTSTLAPWGSCPGPWAEIAVWFILTPSQQQSPTCWEACGCILQGCTSGTERPAPSHTHQTALSRLILAATIIWGSLHYSPRLLMSGRFLAHLGMKMAGQSLLACAHTKCYCKAGKPMQAW